MGFQGQQRVIYNGLANQGATCYLNSILQVLFMTKDFREIIKSRSHCSNEGKELIERELSELFNALEEGCAETRHITRKLRINDVYKQRDAAEYFEKILRLTSKEASQLFHGELRNRSTCQQCHAQTESADGFWHLPLPLVDNCNEYSVEKGIEDFFRPSEISGDDQMYCESCDRKCDAVLDCEVTNHPEVLVFLLKRFEMKFEHNNWRKVKINCPVKMPDTLRMGRNQIYKLYAHVDHFGDLLSGHYNARIKTDDRWYIFDDLNVQMLNYIHFQLDPTEMSKNVYLLFYRKQKEPAVTNMDTHDASQVLPAKPTNRIEDEHSISEEKEKNERASNVKSPTKDVPVSAASMRNADKSRTGKVKSASISRKDEFDHYKEENLSSNRSISQKTSQNENEIWRNNDLEDRKSRETHVKKTYRDENAISGASAQKGEHGAQGDAREWDENSQSWTSSGKHRVSSSVQYRPQWNDGNKSHRQVQRSHSCAPTQNKTNINANYGGHISNTGNPNIRKGGSLVRSHHPSEGERTFQYYSSDVQLESFRREIQGNKMVSPQQCLEKMNKKESRRKCKDHQPRRANSEGCGRGDAEKNPTANKSKNTRRNAERNNSVKNKPHPDNDSDSLVVEMKDLSLNRSFPKKEHSAFIEVKGEVVLQTNSRQSRKRKSCCWFLCVPFKRRRTK